MATFDVLRKLCIANSCLVVLLAVIVCFVPGIPPNVKFSAFKVDKSLPFEGALAPNTKLDDAERLYENHLISPESIASREGPDNEIFVSVHNGDIVRIWGNDHEHHQVIANLGPGCDGEWEEHICGRPLGMRFGPDGLLYIAESYRGIYALNVDKGNKEIIIPATMKIGGRRSRIVDDIDFDGDFMYWSDASSNVVLADGLVELSSDPSGRLIRSNMKTRRHEVLLPNLHFANGVQLSPNKDFVLVCETFKHRVTRYWIKGPKTGRSDVFISGLPGMPDNLRQRVGGGYLISLINVRDPNQTDYYALFAQYPTARKILIKFGGLFKALIDYIDSMYPNYPCKITSYKIFHLSVISFAIDNNRSMIVEVDETGQPIGSYQGKSGKIKLVSQAIQVGDYMFFGSPYVNWLGRLKLNNAKNEEPKPASKPVAQPAVKPATKPAAKPAAKPASKPSAETTTSKPQRAAKEPTPGKKEKKNEL